MAEPTLEPIEPMVQIVSRPADDDKPTDLYAALTEESFSDDEEEDETDEDEDEKEVPQRKRKKVTARRLTSISSPAKKKRGNVEHEEAYYRHLAKEEELKKKAWTINWTSSIINMLVMLTIAGIYVYYAYDAYSMTPEVRFVPDYPLVIADSPYNTTSRLVTQGEIKRDALGIGPGRVPLYALFRTLIGFSKSKDFVVVCAHHLQHAFDVHPQLCILRNKRADQFYTMINPTLKGFSKEKETRVEESVSCGRSKIAKSRYKTIQVRYISHPSKETMQVEFSDQEASTLQLVMDEMSGRYSCT